MKILVFLTPNQPKDVGVYSDLMKNKLPVLQKELKGYEISEYVIFSQSGFTDKLKELSKTNPKLHLLN